MKKYFYNVQVKTKGRVKHLYGFAEYDLSDMSIKKVNDFIVNDLKRLAIEMTGDPDIQRKDIIIHSFNKV